MDGRAVRYEVIETAVTLVRTRVQVLDGASRWASRPCERMNAIWTPLARRLAALRLSGAWHRPRSRPRPHLDARLYEDHWTDEEVRYVRRTWVSPQCGIRHGPNGACMAMTVWRPGWNSQDSAPAADA